MKVDGQMELEEIAKLNTALKPGFELKRDDNFGRYLVSSRDLRCGDVILEETPLSWAPMLDTHPVCLTCVANVNGSYLCPRCGWPMCNSKCAKSDIHKNNECSIFSKAGVKINVKGWDFSSPQPLYNMITILRVSVLDDRLKTIASSLEHHLDVWKKKDEFIQSYKAVVDYIQKILKMDLTEDEILRVITSSYTNDFSHTLQNGNQIQLMFPLTAMMNHSCQPSISRTITTVSNNKQDMMEFKMRVVAAKTLSQGEQIYNSYIDILDPVQVRQKHLALTKQMVCGCTRCSDPTDLGSYGSAVLCQKCQGPVIECGDNSKIWKCERCPAKYSSASIDKIVTRLDEEKNEILEDPAKKKIDIIEKFIKKCSSKLDRRNLIIMRLKYNLIGLYGREPGFTTEEMTEADWTRKREICEEIMDTLKILEPGMTVRKARIMYELHLPILMLAQLSLSKKGAAGCRATTKKEFHKGMVTLKLALKVFDNEPDGSWEKRMVLESQSTLKNIKEILDAL